MDGGFLIALALAALLGASAHRAGLCAVKAVAEVLHARRGHVLWSFVKASLWTAGFLAAAGLLGQHPGLPQRELLANAVVGGLLFGLGAGLNGACSFSTLSRLAEGHLVMLATLAGWIVAMADAAQLLPPAHAGTISPIGGWSLMLTPLLLWEAAAIWRRRGDWHHSSPVWPLAPSVLFIALANAGLILAGHRWSFTGSLLCATQVTSGCAADGLALSATALAAMVTSAVLRGSFRMRLASPRTLARHLAAGLLMGTGAVLIPGGNDGLILFGLPVLSPHALPAWIAIVVGIAVALLTLRAMGRPIARIRCEADFCRTEM